MYSLADIAAATAAARYCTPAQFDHALAAGAPTAHIRLMLVAGATLLAEREIRHHHPEGLCLAVIDRRDQILDDAHSHFELRRLEASILDYRVIADGDDESPDIVVYTATGSTGADWADSLLN